MQHVYVRTRAEWRRWLAKHRGQNTGIWLVFYKKGSDRPTLNYEDAVEEALCFGWIDSIIKKRDDVSYLRKFTPRKPTSRWSELNKKRVAKLTRQGLMHESGLATVKQAKASGQWALSARPDISMSLPEELSSALKSNKKAAAFFDGLAPSYRKHFIGWIASAKRQETRDRRVKESVALLEQGRKLGMK